MTSRYNFNLIRIVILFYSISFFACNIPLNKEEEKAEDVRKIDLDSLSDEAIIRELTIDSGLSDTIFSWRFDKKAFIPRQFHPANRDSLSLEETIEQINRNKFFGKVHINLLEVSHDTVFLKITNAEFLTEKVGFDLAHDFLSTTTFILTDLPGVNFVNFDFNESTEVKAGTFSKSTFYRYSIIRSGDAMTLGLFESNTLKPEIVELNEVEFNEIASGKTSLTQERYIPGINIDSLMKVIESEDSLKEVETELTLQKLLKRFPKALSRNKNCLVLNPESEVRRICRDTSIIYVQSWSWYRLEDYKEGYLVIYITGYEWWSHCFYNPETRKHFEIEGKPVFVDGNFVFGISEYYNSGNFAVYDLKNPDRYFVFNSWTIVDGYRINKTFYLKLRSSTYRTFFQYFKIDFSKEFTY